MVIDHYNMLCWRKSSRVKTMTNNQKGLSIFTTLKSKADALGAHFVNNFVGYLQVRDGLERCIIRLDFDP